MSAKIFSAAVTGLDAALVEIEADLTVGLNAFNIVGLPDKAVEESKERIGAALKNCGAQSPRHQNRRLTVNLAPADVKKEGSLYDLPIALAFLLASDQLAFDPNKKLFLGELALNGYVRPVQGVLPISMLARQLGFSEIFVPKENEREAALVHGVRTFGVSDLSALLEHLEGKRQLTEAPFTKLSQDDTSHEWDFSQIRGLEVPKRALEIAAAGAHNVLFGGAPGGGKTMLAKALPSILPRMSEEEVLEVTKIHSVAGLLGSRQPIIPTRPFRSPHHTASPVAIVGGGSSPKPGEITLAHRGVLFMDELPEFARNVLEALRQPLEEGCISVARSHSTVKFPAQFMFVGAMNPCPCGNYGDPTKICTCSPQAVSRYQRKISGPLLDRIDLHITVPRLAASKLIGGESRAEPSAEIRARINAARKLQHMRFSAEPIATNAEMTARHLERFCPLDQPTESLLKQAIDRWRLSARSYHRIVKVARTIADLAASEHIGQAHVAEAIQYRVEA